MAVFDRHLFELKLQEPAKRMQEETHMRWRQVQSQWAKNHEVKGSGFLADLGDSAFVALREYLDAVDRICREVWCSQGQAISAAFVRGRLRKEVCNAIAAREGALRGEIALRVRRKVARDPTPALRHLAHAVRQLKSEKAVRYEVEARELEYQSIQPPAGYGENATTSPSKSEPLPASTSILESSPTSWREIEIAFLSDERVEIYGGGSRKTYNYSELGFEDRRVGKPNRAWVLLCDIAGRDGAMPRPSPGKNRAMIQKRVQEIRNKLWILFAIAADPIPFNGTAYQTSFRLSRRPSFDT